MLSSDELQKKKRKIEEKKIQNNSLSAISTSVVTGYCVIIIALCRARQNTNPDMDRGRFCLQRARNTTVHRLTPPIALQRRALVIRVYRS